MARLIGQFINNYRNMLIRSMDRHPLKSQDSGQNQSTQIGVPIRSKKINISSIESHSVSSITYSYFSNNAEIDHDCRTIRKALIFHSTPFTVSINSDV